MFMDNFQVVYVGVIAPMHKPVVDLMLRAKKAVLCEKPLGLSLEEVSMNQCRLIKIKSN